MLGFVVLKKLTNSSFLIEEKKDDEELPSLKIKIKRLQERHPMVEDFKIRVWAKMLVLDSNFPPLKHEIIAVSIYLERIVILYCMLDFLVFVYVRVQS